MWTSWRLRLCIVYCLGEQYLFFTYTSDVDRVYIRCIPVNLPDMDLHPVFVHFPIALLSVYAAVEVVRVPKLVRTSWWFPLKSVLVIIGSVAGVVTFFSGWLLEQAAEQNGIVPKVMEMHGNFALYTVIVFGVLALAHAVVLLRKYFNEQIIRVAESILQPWVVIPLAILGLVLITITGSLGGAMVYGPDVDPIVKAVYNLFVGAGN